MLNLSTGEILESKSGIALAYAIFAVFSIIVNILFQEMSLWIYSLAYSLYVSILAGTFAGLIVKYILDKRYIFNYQTISLADGSKTFILYSVMGVGTTFVFWGFELSFDYLFNSKMMRYVGAVIGLAIGYFLKYHLDKRFVFKS